jgi:hypothetical protein
LKSLKAAGDETYNQMIAIMDGSVAAIEKSGIFNELGKRGNGESSITKTIDGHAAEILKANPDLNWHQASAKAWDAHPELLEEYEQSRQ